MSKRWRPILVFVFLRSPGTNGSYTREAVYAERYSVYYYILNNFTGNELNSRAIFARGRRTGVTRAPRTWPINDLLLHYPNEITGPRVNRTSDGRPRTRPARRTALDPLLSIAERTYSQCRAMQPPRIVTSERLNPLGRLSRLFDVTGDAPFCSSPPVLLEVEYNN